MRRLLIVLAVLFLAPAASFGQSQVPSIRDIVELTKAGVADEVLLALIEVNGPVYPVDAQTLKNLKAAGVSSAVIVAMVRSGRATPTPVEASVPVVEAPEAPQAPPPQVIVVDHEAQREPRAREVAVPVAIPVYIAVPSRHVRGDDIRRSRHHEPVYWGFGGKLRPDAWRTAADVQKDAKVPREPQKK